MTLYGIMALIPFAILSFPKKQIILIKNDTAQFYFSVVVTMLLVAGIYFFFKGLIKLIKSLALFIKTKKTEITDGNT